MYTEDLTGKRNPYFSHILQGLCCFGAVRNDLVVDIDCQRNVLVVLLQLLQSLQSSGQPQSTLRIASLQLGGSVFFCTTSEGGEFSEDMACEYDRADL